MKTTPRRIAFRILMHIAVLVVLLVVGSAVAIWLGLGPTVHSRQVATQSLNIATPPSRDSVREPLFRKFIARGLVPPDRDSPIHHGPTEQTWGTTEFMLDDPDGNSLVFTQEPV